jgi:hypothetical protein
MAGTNGHSASVLDVLNLGDLTAKRTTVTVTRDGQLVALPAYLYGDNVLGTVLDEIAGHREAFLAVANDPELNNLQKNTAYTAYLRGVLLALVPGMEFFEADTLSGKKDKAVAVLQELGFFTRSDEPEAAPEVANDTPLTMAQSSRISPSTRTRNRKSR